MTDRKPDFYVVKRGSNAKREKVEWLANGHHWVDSCALSFRYLDRNGAAIDAANRCGRVVPVFCTSKRAEPKMRERSSAWVLKRLAEGKVLYRPRHAAGSIMFSETLIRWERVDGIIEFCVPGEMVWSSKRGQLCFDGKMLCRVARPSEVPQ